MKSGWSLPGSGVGLCRPRCALASNTKAIKNTHITSDGQRIARSPFLAEQGPLCGGCAWSVSPPERSGTDATATGTSRQTSALLSSTENAVSAQPRTLRKHIQRPGKEDRQTGPASTLRCRLPPSPACAGEGRGEGSRTRQLRNDPPPVSFLFVSLRAHPRRRAGLLEAADRAIPEAMAFS